MKLRSLTAHTAFLLLAVASASSHADSVTASLDLSTGNTSFGRNNAVGAFVDSYLFTLTETSYFVSSTASSASSGLQDLDFSSLVIQDATNTVIATYAGNFGNDNTEFYSLSQLFLSPGSYSLVVTGTNSASQASYTGNIAVTASAVPEPATGALAGAGLALMAFLMRRRPAH